MSSERKLFDAMYRDLCCKGQHGTYKSVALAIWQAARATPVVAQEPVAWMWQHDETGRTGFVEADFDQAHWAKHNPRLLIVRPLYAHSAPDVAAIRVAALEDLAEQWENAAHELTIPSVLCSDWYEGQAKSLQQCAAELRALATKGTT